MFSDRNLLPLSVSCIIQGVPKNSVYFLKWILLVTWKFRYLMCLKDLKKNFDFLASSSADFRHIFGWITFFPKSRGVDATSSKPFKQCYQTLTTVLFSTTKCLENKDEPPRSVLFNWRLALQNHDSAENMPKMGTPRR